MTAPSQVYAGSDQVPVGAARSWLANLAPEKRAAIRELYRLRPARNLIALFFLGMWLGTGAVVLWIPAWPVRVLGYVAMGFALHALGILMHEAVHGNFFRRQTLDRWAGFLLGAPTVVSAAAYRVTHLLHHRFNRGGKDPDEFGNYLKSPRLLSLAFYGWGLLGMLVFLVHVPLNALRLGSPRERARVIAEYGLLACLYGAALWIAVRLDATGALIQVWLVPMGIAFLIVNLRGWSEHMLTEAGHPLTQSRTVTSNALVRFFLCNLNYHLEHHLFPAVPWYNLPRLHALLQDEYRRAGSFIYGSYLRFFWDAVRAGVHGRAPKRGAAGATNRLRSRSLDGGVVHPGPSPRALIVYPPMVALALGWSLRAGGLSWGAWSLHLLGGLALWTLLEYALHRFLFHIVPSAPWLQERQQHLAHHRAPVEPAFFIAPLWLSIPTALVVWAALCAVLGTWDRGAVAAAGVVLGYLAYELIHWRVHLPTRGGRLTRVLRRYHFYHHYRDDRRCFGVTSPLWDRVFGTAPARRARRARPLEERR